LRNVLRPHADADARADFITGDGRREELAAAHSGTHFRNRNERRQHDGADMQHPLPMHVVQFEALHLGAVDQGSMRRRKLLPRTPHRASLRGIESAQDCLQNAAPLQLGAVQGASQRIEHQQLDAPDDFRRDRVVTQPGYELGNAPGVAVVGNRGL
jgi:hypothetical protein